MSRRFLELLRGRANALLVPERLSAAFADGFGPMARGLQDAALDAALAAGSDELQHRLPFIRALELRYRAPYGGREDLLEAALTLSLLETEAGALYTQAELLSRNRELGANIGLGYRFDLTEGLQLGINLFYDWLREPDLQRISTGLEAKTPLVDFSANLYDALGSRIRSEDGGNIIYGLDGWDVEAEGRLPWLPWLAGAVRYYQWNRRFGVGDLQGQEYSLLATPIPLLELRLNYDDPETADPDWGGSISLRYDFSRSRQEQLQWQNSASIDYHWEQRRYRRVRRQSEQRTQKLRDPGDDSFGGGGDQVTGRDPVILTIQLDDLNRRAALSRETPFIIRLGQYVLSATVQVGKAENIPVTREAPVTGRSSDSRYAEPTDQTITIIVTGLRLADNVPAGNTCQVLNTERGLPPDTMVTDYNDAAVVRTITSYPVNSTATVTCSGAGSTKSAVYTCERTNGELSWKGTAPTCTIMSGTDITSAGTIDPPLLPPADIMPREMMGVRPACNILTSIPENSRVTGYRLSEIGAIIPSYLSGAVFAVVSCAEGYVPSTEGPESVEYRCTLQGGAAKWVGEGSACILDCGTLTVENGLSENLQATHYRHQGIDTQSPYLLDSTAVVSCAEGYTPFTDSKESVEYRCTLQGGAAKWVGEGLHCCAGPTTEDDPADACRCYGMPSFQRGAGGLTQAYSVPMGAVSSRREEGGQMRVSYLKNSQFEYSCTDAPEGWPRITYTCRRGIWERESGQEHLSLNPNRGGNNCTCGPLEQEDELVTIVYFVVAANGERIEREGRTLPGSEATVSCTELEQSPEYESLTCMEDREWHDDKSGETVQAARCLSDTVGCEDYTPSNSALEVRNYSDDSQEAPHKTNTELALGCVGSTGQSSLDSVALRCRRGSWEKVNPEALLFCSGEEISDYP